jgi:hypothetical protein
MISAAAMDAMPAVFFRAGAVACDEAAWPCDDLEKENAARANPDGVSVSNGKERLALLALFGLRLARGLRDLSSLLFRSHSINLPRHWDDQTSASIL